MTIRVRNGGVYDWDVPGPNTGRDSEYQASVRVMAGVLRAERKQDHKGRRKVFHSNGLEIGVIVHRDRWYIHGHLFADGQMRKGKLDKRSLATCLRQMAQAL